ncbi:hypothetical protein F8388_018224 [Cannabis sativa]|uniref:Defensin-like domain-containing protein n=1 Tax=Cannabis sativa TaxID=3483 RepID=A0A7J6GD19_CANSA|nr:hypothetical protein F8388_018224 [Cannabis sativa]
MSSFNTITIISFMCIALLLVSEPGSAINLPSNCMADCHYGDSTCNKICIEKLFKNGGKCVHNLSGGPDLKCCCYNN